MKTLDKATIEVCKLNGSLDIHHVCECFLVYYSPSLSEIHAYGVDAGNETHDTECLRFNMKLAPADVCLKSCLS